ncbi:MAG: type IX secretion system membrane protein PorP/SprF [Bacteroidales bacterium]
MKAKVRIYKIVLIFVLGIITHEGWTQQLPLYTQYTMNGFLLNPAFAGSNGYTSVNLMAREQWIGLPNSPKTHSISAQTRILPNSYINNRFNIRKKKRPMSRDGRVGIGGYIFNDRTGLIDRTGMQFTYAYHIRLYDDSQLSFGLSVNAYQFKINQDKMILQDQGDITVDGNRNAVYIPDASFGALWMSKEFYLGFSANELAQSSQKLFKQNINYDYQMYRHYYLIGGYKYEYRRYFIIEPSALIKASQAGALQADLGVTVSFDNEYWGGISYRTGNSLSFLMGVKVENFYFGYAFDYTISSIMRHTFGSHEFMAAVRFGENARRYRWLNRF